jgi:hypothetical protein
LPLSTVQSIVNRFHKVTAMDFDGCFNLEENVMAWALSQNQIVRLDLSYCTNATTSFFGQATHSLSHLVSLQLAGCRKFNAVALEAMVGFMPLIECLDISEMVFGNVTMHTITSKCTQLRKLGLAGCTGIVRPIIVPPEPPQPPLVKCTMLKHLDLSNTAMTDAVLESIVSACPNLRHLNVAYNRLITNVGVAVITVACPLLLRTLNLRGLPSLTFGGVGMLQRCKLLGDLDVLNCNKIDDYDLDKLASQCPQLRTITAGCSRGQSTSLTGDGCRSVASCHPNTTFICRNVDIVEHLNPKGCSQDGPLCLKIR